MREYVSRKKKTTTDFSIPSLKHPTHGFGLGSLAISRQGVPGIQPLHKPVTHDISRIPLRTQAKLSISQPGDIYEQEADSVAQQVMQRMAQPVNSQSIQREALPEEEEELQMKPLDISTLQREALPEEEEELQMKPLDISTLQREALPEEEEELQMKPLDISTLQREALPEEEEELQMKPLDISTLQREALPEEEEELQMKSLDSSTLQREALPEEEEELQMKPMVQRQSKAGMDATPDLETSINQARGGGQTMADNIREPMEQAFGTDFSGVKVHTDGQSDQLNRSIQARAFTTGQDVFFRQGEYNPGSRGGQELLAHELTHVVQQNGGAVQRSPNAKTIQRMDGKESKDEEKVETAEVALVLYDVSASSAHHNIKLIVRMAPSAAAKEYGFSFVDKNVEAEDIVKINEFIRSKKEDGQYQGPQVMVEKGEKEGMIRYTLNRRTYSTHTNTTQLFPVAGEGIIAGKGKNDMVEALIKLNIVKAKDWPKLLYDICAEDQTKAWAQQSTKVKELWQKQAKEKGLN